MKKLLALLLALTMALALVACGGNNAANDGGNAASGNNSTSEDAGSDWPEPLSREKRDPIAKEDLKIGLICVHDENSGYDVAHIDGLKGACEELGIDPSQVTFKYNIPEDETCYDAAVELAESGCQLIISNSYGHQSYVAQVAEEYPEITFVAMTGDNAASSGQRFRIKREFDRHVH